MSARFLIEVPHDASTVGCARVVDIFLKSGSHYLTRADWGCRDGEHKSWMIVDLATREEALRILPPAFREHAHVVQLNKFSVEEIEQILKEHGE